MALPYDDLQNPSFASLIEDLASSHPYEVRNLVWNLKDALTKLHSVEDKKEQALGVWCLSSLLSFAASPDPRVDSLVSVAQHGVREAIYGKSSGKPPTEKPKRPFLVRLFT